MSKNETGFINAAAQLNNGANNNNSGTSATPSIAMDNGYHIVNNHIAGGMNMGMHFGMMHPLIGTNVPQELKELLPFFNMDILRTKHFHMIITNYLSKIERLGKLFETILTSFDQSIVIAKRINYNRSSFLSYRNNMNMGMSMGMGMPNGMIYNSPNFMCNMNNSMGGTNELECRHIPTNMNNLNGLNVNGSTCADPSGYTYTFKTELELVKELAERYKEIEGCLKEISKSDEFVQSIFNDVLDVIFCLEDSQFNQRVLIEFGKHKKYDSDIIPSYPTHISDNI